MLDERHNSIRFYILLFGSIRFFKLGQFKVDSKKKEFKLHLEFLDHFRLMLLIEPMLTKFYKAQLLGDRKWKR